MNEPVGLVAALNAVITAVLGVLTITEVLEPDVAGAVGVALAACIAAVGVYVRGKVTPVENPTLTSSQATKLTIQD